MEHIQWDFFIVPQNHVFNIKKKYFLEKLYNLLETKHCVRKNDNECPKPHHHHLTITSYDKNLRSQVWQACFQFSNKPTTSQNLSKLGVQQFDDCFYRSPRTAWSTWSAKFVKKTKKKLKQHNIINSHRFFMFQIKQYINQFSFKHIINQSKRFNHIWITVQHFIDSVNQVFKKTVFSVFLS